MKGNMTPNRKRATAIALLFLALVPACFAEGSGGAIDWAAGVSAAASGITSTVGTMIPGILGLLAISVGISMAVKWTKRAVK